MGLWTKTGSGATPRDNTDIYTWFNFFYSFTGFGGEYYSTTT